MDNSAEILEWVDFVETKAASLLSESETLPETHFADYVSRIEAFIEHETSVQCRYPRGNNTRMRKVIRYIQEDLKSILADLSRVRTKFAF